MKKIIAAAAISSFVATSAFAGSMEAPMMEDKPMETMVEKEPASASGIVVPLLAVLMLGVAASQ